MMYSTDLIINSYHDYYHRYISLVPNERHLVDALREGGKITMTYFEKLPHDIWDYAYQPDKWTIKEVLQHIIDTERIFMYRCLCLSRKDSTPLPGFDQAIYIPSSGASKKSKEILLDEFAAQRKASILLVASLDMQDLQFIGTVSDHPMSAAAAAFVVVGHEIWHMDIIDKLYLTSYGS